MRTPEGDRICEILRKHQGREQMISAPDICRELGWRRTREREVRRVIAAESMLWDGVLVCSVGGIGFFCADHFDDVCAYDNWLTDLAAAATQKRDQFRTLCTRMGLRFPEERKDAAA
jgi:hypothetical protein